MGKSLQSSEARLLCVSEEPDLVAGSAKKAEMSSGPPENGAFVWGTDEGQGGDCVGGPEVPHRLAPP